jgi:hypothetical protein
MSLEAISGASGIRRLVALGALALYAASLWLPVATTTLVSEQVIPGYEILVTGFLGAFDGQFAWYANPLMIWSMAWLFTRGHVARHARARPLGLHLGAAAHRRRVL